jgi:hypothetical protein
MVAGASTVAGVVATVVVAGATLFAGEVAGLSCATALDVAGSVAGLCCVIAVEVAGLVAGCVVVPRSGGSGARVSEGSAFETIGVSTLGEFVVTGPGVFSFFAKACEAGGACGALAVVASIPGTVAGDFSGAVSGGFVVLFIAMAGAGIGLGSIEGAESIFATSVEGVTGAAATVGCCCWSQPTS